MIEALRDRIDVVVRALHFNTRFLGELLTRMEEGVAPEEVMPSQLVFSQGQLEQVYQEIMAVTLPVPLRKRLEFFASWFEFFEPAGEQIEYKTKDALKLSGVELHLLANETGKDKLKELGTQTKNGLSVRALFGVIAFIKAMAYFRGSAEVGLEDIRQLLPFVLHDKLVPDPDSPFFEAPGNSVFRVDRISWIRRLFDLSCAEYDRLDRDREDPVAEFEAEFQLGLEGLPASDVKARLVKIERYLQTLSEGRKLYGHLHDDVLMLKYLHQRYTNYLNWLQWNQG